MIKIIGFDLDDTLWEVAPVIYRAEKELNQWLSLQVPRLKFDVQQMRELRQQVLQEKPDLSNKVTELRRCIIERAMLLSNISPHAAKKQSATAIEVFLTARNEITLFAGAESILQALARQFSLCALTNGNADINRLGLGHLFSFSYSAEQVGAPKPAPNMFLRALEHSQHAAPEMIYVGDNPIHDVDTAKKLGIHTIWLNRNAQVPGEYPADEEIKQISELPGAIQRIQHRTNNY
ncbi:MAG: HAD-IA family hydrolase [Pseudomonadales bacterium]|nr:HAD-IA family hydrolase [Pseudomonadales bacterium]